MGFENMLPNHHLNLYCSPRSPTSKTQALSSRKMSEAKQTFRIASIPGDGIGTEITSAAIQVLNTLSSVTGTFTLDFEEFDWSSENYKKRGWYTPPDGFEQLKKYDAIYFGAVGWPDVPDHISLWQMILPIRTTVGSLRVLADSFSFFGILGWGVAESTWWWL